MKIRQYIPDRVSLVKAPVEEEFEDLLDLFGVPFVAAYRKQANFDHFAISPFGRGGWALIAVFDSGRTWWVVGHISELSQKLQDNMIHWSPK